MTGTLVLAATPIGNAGDATPRLLSTLAQAPVIAAEDTRRLRGLTARLGVTLSGRVVSYHEHNEASRTGELLEALVGGSDVLLVTDAGMPSVSDPGYRLVGAAIAAQVPVTCLPGPSAVLASLAVSGLPVDRFSFEGFPPRKAGERDRMLRQLADEQRTMVFFESPHRLAATLTAMGSAFGQDRAAAVCRELTKTYEEVRRGPVAELATWALEGVKGEITIVVAGATPPSPADLDQSAIDAIVDGIRDRVAGGERLKQVCAEESARTGIPKNTLYAAAIAARE